MLKNILSSKILLTTFLDRGGFMLPDGGAVIYLKEGVKKGLGDKARDKLVESLVEPITKALLSLLVTVVGVVGDVVFVAGGIILAFGMLCIMFRWFKPLKVGALVTAIGLLIKCLVLF